MTSTSLFMSECRLILVIIHPMMGIIQYANGFEARMKTSLRQHDLPLLPRQTTIDQTLLKRSELVRVVEKKYIMTQNIVTAWFATIIRQSPRVGAYIILCVAFLAGRRDDRYFQIPWSPVSKTFSLTPHACGKSQSPELAHLRQACQLQGQSANIFRGLRRETWKGRIPQSCAPFYENREPTWVS